MESPLLSFYKDVFNRSQKQKETTMILTEEQRKEFEEKVKPVMEWLCKNFHPHVTIIIEPTQAEILEGSASVVTDEYVRD